MALFTRLALSRAMALTRRVCGPGRGRHLLVDHRELADLFIVDRVSGKPIGRPYLTLTIDVSTRRIYDLSVDRPDLTVRRAGIAGVRERLSKLLLRPFRHGGLSPS